MELASLALGLAGYQAMMVLRNLRHFKAPEDLPPGLSPDPLSVLIPARDEERNLATILKSLQSQQDCEFEVHVLDDNSTDSTFGIASAFAESDKRFFVHRAPELPPGWAGKQHACHLLSQKAVHGNWLFLDADLELTSPRALRQISGHLSASQAGMLSSVPLQITGTWAEKLIIPLIQLVLLGFLPFWVMRRNTMPALGAACGQLVAVKRDVYLAVGGHEVIKERLHDAQAMAHRMRHQGYLTDLFDSTPLARCRMYQNASEVFSGFAKNATEGMAQPKLLPIWTVVLGGACVLPWMLPLLGHDSPLIFLAQLLNVLAFVTVATRCRQNLLWSLSRPFGILVFLLIQWAAFFGKYLGWKATWKGRSYDRL